MNEVQKKWIGNVCCFSFFPVNSQFLSFMAASPTSRLGFEMKKLIFEYSLHHLPVSFSRLLAVDRDGWKKEKTDPSKRVE
jgi:hypothetical protein